MSNSVFSLIYDEKWKEIEEILKFDDSVDVNMLDENGKYFMNYAIIHNKIDIVSLLINKGAKLDIYDSDGKTILYIPIEFKYKKMLELLLFFNKSSIGKSLVEHKDNMGRIPLHYSIMSNNVSFCRILLDSTSDVNLYDVNGDNSLILAVRNQYVDVCRLILEFNPNIDYKNVKTGETALIVATKLKNKELVKMLLKNGANPSLYDMENEYSSLNYSIIYKSPDIFKILLRHNANINHQDYYGNSILHNIILKKSLEFLDLFIDEKGVQLLNVNQHNIDLKLPLHLIFEKNLHINDRYMEYFIYSSDLNFIDSNKVSILHLLIKNELWKKYIKILVKKKLDIFTVNSKGEMPVLLIKNKKDLELLLDVVTKSYINLLGGSNIIWDTEWENMCKKIDDLTDSQIKSLTKLGSGDKSNICYNIIYGKLKKQTEIYIKNSEKGDVSYDNSKSFTSYPSKKSQRCITSVRNDTVVDYCKFYGISLDILFGVIYILNKHPNTCSILSSSSVHNKKLFEYYKSAGISTNTGGFINFEIVWANKELHLFEGFVDRIMDCVKQNKEYIIIPIGIELDNGNHANYIVYDIVKSEVERFEPYGYSNPSGFNYEPDKLDERIYNIFKNINDKIKYFKPKDYMPKIGFQLLDAVESQTSKVGDPGGFCALWSIWYVDMRIMYGRFERTELVRELIKDIKNNNLSFKNVIRNYSKDVVMLRDELFDKVKVNINDWINNTMSKEQYNDMINYITEQIKEL